MNDLHDRVQITLSPAQAIDVVRKVAGEDDLAAATAGLPEYRWLMRERRAARARGLSGSLLMGMAVLACFPASGEGLRVADIASRLKVSSGFAHRYVRTLVVAGLLEQGTGSRRYRRVTGT